MLPLEISQKCSKGMWHLGIWFSVEHIGAGLMVGLDHLTSVFQPLNLLSYKFLHAAFAEKVAVCPERQ